MLEIYRVEYEQKLTGDLGLVEQLGSGVPRNLEIYYRDCFSFSNNCLRMAFPSPKIVYSVDAPQVTTHDTSQVTPQVEQVIAVLEGDMSRDEILEALDLSDRNNLRENYLNPAFDAGLIECTLPNKPKSKHQKYRLTEKGKAYKKSL